MTNPDAGAFLLAGEQGFTKREYFAVHLLAPAFVFDVDEQRVERAVRLADMLIAGLNETAHQTGGDARDYRQTQEERSERC